MNTIKRYPWFKDRGFCCLAVCAVGFVIWALIQLGALGQAVAGLGGGAL